MAEYQYNQEGQRVERERGGLDFGGNTSESLYYDKDGRLERAGDVSFAYDDRGALSVWRDHEHQLEYSFSYTDLAVLDAIRVTPLPPAKSGPSGRDSVESDWLDVLVRQKRTERLRAMLGKSGGVLELRCGLDQVGTLTLLTDKRGFPVKEIRRDSFGLLLSDSLPDLFIPVGFAGGLEDPDTGLVHFGYRDYDIGGGCH